MTCKDATRLMIDEHLNDAGLLTRVWARAHCMMCPHCRRYAAHLRGIGCTVALESTPASRTPTRPFTWSPTLPAC